MFQYDVAPINVAEVCQPFDEPPKIGPFFLGARRVPQHPNSRNFSCLLRTPRDRPSCGRRCTAKGSHELTSPHGALPKTRQNAGASGHRDPSQDRFLRSIVPTDGTRLPIDRSGDFGASPFSRQLSGKQGRLTACERYTVSGSMTRSANGMVRPCSSPTSKRSWPGAAKSRSTPCHTNSTAQSP